MYLSATAISSTIPAIRSVFLALQADHPEDDDPNKDVKNWSSLIGIVTAIVGNVLIALALNVQRYAHIRLHRQRIQNRVRAKQALKHATNGGGIYGTIADADNGTNGRTGRQDSGGRGSNGHEVDEDAREDDPLAQSFQSGDSAEDEDDEASKQVSSTYLKDPYWWLGQVLITVGECGNFLAYGFAPASIVSPLGVVALISNCVIAPMLFKEIFRTRDFWGVVIAIAGACTVVLSANTEETKLDPHDVWDAITTMAFEIYVAVTCSLIAVLMWASPRYGHRTILIDLGLVGLFGGYTALSTKGVSSMLSSTLLGAFTTPVTYALVLVLFSTAIMQVRYVNRALQRFDSTQVIPIQFVLFTLCVIIGSAVLYRDFERTTVRQAAKFVGGCLLTFFGVFLITSGRPRHDEEEDVLSDEEGVEETIGLAQQGPGATTHHVGNHPSSRRGSDSARSRRSSKASHVNFSDAMSKPLTVVAESGVPTIRIPAAANNKPTSGAEAIEEEALLPNPWREGETDAINSRAQHHRRLETPAISSESVPTISSTGISDTSMPPLGTPRTHSHSHSHAPVSPHPDHPPETPRPATSGSRPHSHVFGGPFISPSPFHSTVSGVLVDRLLPQLHAESPISRRVGSRRSRPSLRNSLFVSHEDLDDGARDDYDDEREREIASAVERSSLGRRRSHYSGGEESEVLTDGEASHSGFRGRARSLSNTLGELFGVRRKSKAPNAEGGSEEQRPFLAPSPGDEGTETP